MNYSDFCQPFYSATKMLCGLKGITSQKGIAEFFVSTALGEHASSCLVFSDSLFAKWFKGEREPAEDIWAKVSEVFNEEVFSRALTAKLNDAALPNMISIYEISIVAGLVPDKYAFAAALTKQFKAIADGCGSADNLMLESYEHVLNVTDFPNYIDNSYRKYSKLKTLLYSSEERSFDEFFCLQ